uniref:CbaR n=1 Tax=Conidiobolus coronatus TaxID=34488 RepID=Q9FCY4_9FUNG|nr:CbaR [Conidiobolus coronatus]
MLARDPRKSRVTLNLDTYTPAFFTAIANKLASGASKDYLKNFGIGIETWRVLALIAVAGETTAQSICQFTGMDKGSVSKVMKQMLAKGLIVLATADRDKRVRLTQLTEEGQAMHDKIILYALHRENSLLSVLTASERETLVRLLQRLKENINRVDIDSSLYVKAHWHRESPQE